MNITDELYITGVNELKEVIKNIRLFGIPDQNFKIDLTIARGLDYYTGTVYETFLNEYKQLGSVCSGGRYDNLAEFYTDKKLPGVGISIGLSRLFYQLSELNAFNQKEKSIAKVLVVAMDDNEEQQTMSKAIEVATLLRNNGISTQIYTENKKIKAKFKYADKLKIPYVAVIGENEVNNNKITLKNMSTGEQEEIEINNEALKKYFE